MIHPITTTNHSFSWSGRGVFSVLFSTNLENLITLNSSSLYVFRSLGFTRLLEKHLEHRRDEHESVKESEDDRQREHFKEHSEHVRRRRREEHQRQERRGSPVQDRRADVDQRCTRPAEVP